MRNRHRLILSGRTVVGTGILAATCFLLFCISACTTVSETCAKEKHDSQGYSTPFTSPPAAEPERTLPGRNVDADTSTLFSAGTSTSGKRTRNSPAKVVVAPTEILFAAPPHRFIHKQTVFHFHAAQGQNFWYYVGAFFLSLFLCITIPGFALLLLGYVLIYSAHHWLSRMGEILVIVGLLSILAEIAALVLLIAGSPAWLTLALILLSLGIVCFPFLFSLFLQKR